MHFEPAVQYWGSHQISRTVSAVKNNGKTDGAVLVKTYPLTIYRRRP
jgi:hypothetical protein